MGVSEGVSGGAGVSEGLVGDEDGGEVSGG